MDHTTGKQTVWGPELRASACVDNSTTPCKLTISEQHYLQSSPNPEHRTLLSQCPASITSKQAPWIKLGHTQNHTHTRTHTWLWSTEHIPVSLSYGKMGAGVLNKSFSLCFIRAISEAGDWNEKRNKLSKSIHAFICTHTHPHTHDHQT